MKHSILITLSIFLFGCFSCTPLPECENKQASILPDSGHKNGQEWTCHQNGKWQSRGEWKEGKRFRAFEPKKRKTVYGITGFPASRAACPRLNSPNCCGRERKVSVFQGFWPCSPPKPRLKAFFFWKLEVKQSLKRLTPHQKNRHTCIAAYMHCIYAMQI